MGYSPRGYKSQTWLGQLSMHAPGRAWLPRPPVEGTHSPHPTQMPGAVRLGAPICRLDTPATGFGRSKCHVRCPSSVEARGPLPSRHPSLHPPAITWGPMPTAQSWPWLAAGLPCSPECRSPAATASTGHLLSLSQLCFPIKERKWGGGQNVKGICVTMSRYHPATSQVLTSDLSGGQTRLAVRAGCLGDNGQGTQVSHSPNDQQAWKASP